MQVQLAALAAGLVPLVPLKLQQTSAGGELRQNLLHLLRRLCQGVGGAGPAVLHSLDAGDRRERLPPGAQSCLVWPCPSYWFFRVAGKSGMTWQPSLGGIRARG